MAAIAEWMGLGRQAEVLPLQVPRPRRAPRPRGASAFSPVVFLWPAGALDDDAAAALHDALGQDEGAAPPIERMSRDRRKGWAIVQAGVTDALAAGQRLLAATAGLGPEARVICDFGCVLGAGLEPDARMLARLQAAADLPGFPPGRLLATAAFAMEARYGHERAARPVAIGRIEAGDRQRPADGVFLLVPPDAFGGPPA
jgi:hypothetical protein